MKRKLISMLLAVCLIMSCFAISGISVSAAEAPDATGSIQGGQTIYFQPSGYWTNDNARFAVYYFGNTDGWVDAKDAKDGIYKVDIPTGTWEGIIAVRMNPATTENNWDNKWNQTSNITSIPAGKNLLKVNDDNVSWGTYTPQTATTAPATTVPVTTEPVQETTQGNTGLGSYTVYFTDTLNWGCPNLYFWEAGPTWPGTQMDFYEVNSNNQNVYKLEISSEATGVVFNWNDKQTVDITSGIYEGAHWYALNQKDGDKYKVQAADPIVEETKTVYVGMDPVVDTENTGYRVRYELVKGSGDYKYANLTYTKKDEVRKFDDGDRFNGVDRWYQIYSAEIPKYAQSFCVVDNSNFVFSGKTGDATDNNAVYIYTDIDGKGYYHFVAQYINIDFDHLSEPEYKSVYIGAQEDIWRDLINQDIKVYFNWYYFPDTVYAGYANGTAEIMACGTGYHELGQGYFNGLYTPYEMFEAKVPVFADRFYVTCGGKTYTVGGEGVTINESNTLFLFNPDDAGSTDNYKFKYVYGVNGPMFKNVYVGMDPVQDHYNTGYRVRYERVAGSGNYEYADIAPTDKADVKAFSDGYQYSGKSRWYDVYSAEIPVNVNNYCVVDQSNNVFGSKTGDASKTNIAYVFTDVDNRGYYYPTVNYDIIDFNSLTADWTTLYVGVEVDNDMNDNAWRGEFELHYTWDYLPNTYYSGFTSGASKLSNYVGSEYRKLGNDYFGGKYTEFDVFEVKVPSFTENYFVTWGNKTYTTSDHNGADPAEYNAIYIFDSADAGSENDHVFLNFDELLPDVPPEEPAEDDVTIQVVVPDSYLQTYKWNSVDLYYTNKGKYAEADHLAMTKTDDVYYVNTANNNIKSIVNASGWSVYSITLTPEQVEAIDSSKIAGFAAGNNLSRTKFASANNIFKAAVGAYGSYKSTAASVASFDGCTFVICDSLGTGAAAYTAYTGYWTEGYTTVKFAAPVADTMRSTWDNVSFCYGDSYDNSTAVAMANTLETTKVTDVGNMSTLKPGRWYIFAATLDAAQTEAANTAAYAGFTKPGDTNRTAPSKNVLKALTNEFTGTYGSARTLQELEGQVFVVKANATATSRLTFNGEWETEDVYTAHNSDTVTIYFVAPTADKDSGAWNTGVELYYTLNNSTDYKTAERIEMTKSNNVKYDADLTGTNLKAISSGEWDFYEAELSEEQIVAIDQSNNVGFIKKGSYNRTSILYTKNITKASKTEDHTYSTKKQTIEAFDGFVFMIDSCTDTANERTSYTGYWVGTTA